ncbi:MAG TPA: EscU/YscU/HrcU family type III secretion system export apparatus switch protein, partial [Chloroflexota bacterium]|nr:EscU/YscU/HrcU family type III secretion system export apparatus switch protein [Chloroflexota bacterium]
AAAFLVIAGIDYGYRQFAYYRRHRMTKQEQKEEYKRMEGNPQVRSRMRQIARRRLRAILEAGGIRKVPTADVVVTNPTHFAVAIQYRAGKMGAPKVIAKGQNLIALRIKDAARKHNIPMVENRPLAQALYKSVEVNQEIPADLYQAVAQVLAFVYRLRAPRRVIRRAAPVMAGPGRG